ncbi:MAG: S41 family peptidase [Janthinobacterium lividum]
MTVALRTTLALLLVLLSGPGWAQTAGRGEFQAQLAASVVSAALTFIAPRALDPVTVRQLALWGLAGPAALDDSLSTELRDGTMVLLRNDRVLFQQAIAGDDDAAGWGALVSALLGAAVQNSADVRVAGMNGVLGAFFDEVFNHLDPYSRYVPPGAAGPDRARRSGEAGAGLQVTRQGGAFVVTDVNADGPAAEAGIKVTDRIIAVDEQPTAGEDLDTVLGWIAGMEGTDLTLTVRTRAGAVRTFEIERAVITPETVFARRTGDILLIRISGFSADTDQRLERELTRNLARVPGRGIRGVVLDLRSNRGGLLQQAVRATDLFLTGGIIATTAGRNPNAMHDWRATSTDLAGGRPLVVLVDGRSASAAEIMAAALADQGRAVVVGSATLGKGLVQTISTLPDGGELFVSWSRVLAPDGWPLQGLGVMPQVCTSLGQDQTMQQLSALERRTAPMAGPIARHHAARAPLPTAESLALRNPCPAAEPRESDMVAARFLISHPAAYATARLTPP